MVCDPAVALVYPRLEASLALGQHEDAHPRPQVVVGRIVARKTAVTQSDALLGHHIVDVVVVSHEGAHHIAALDHRGEHAGVQRPGAFILGGTADPDRCATAALFHDASEILTGDLPTPVKYYNPDIRAAYKQVERVSADKLLELLPEALRPSYAPLVRESDPTVHDIVKAADKLSAHIKCIEELRAGNQEFASAAEQTRQALTDMHLPELDWFLEHCLDSFGKNLDQLE